MSNFCLTKCIFISFIRDRISIFLVMIHITISFKFCIWSSSIIIVMNLMPFKESIEIVLVSFSNSINLLVPRKSLINFMSVFILLSISDNDFIVIISSSFIVSSFPLLLLCVKLTFCKLKISIKEGVML